MVDTAHPCPRCGETIINDATHCASCGQTHTLTQDAPEAWIGRTVDGKYVIEGVLGVGGMGMVFRARRVMVGDQVALKVLFPRFLESSLQRSLFDDEARASARLSHPNVVMVFDAGHTADNVAYIAMELLEGRTFKELLKAEAPMPAKRLLPFMIQTLMGLEAAHRAQIIHRDLKPDNIFLEMRPDGTERVKLVDFGIAAMLDATDRDEQRKLLGTLRYMSPEQCRGDAIDARSDLYALGVLLYESLTRRRATGKSLSAVINDAVVPPREVLTPENQLAHPLEMLVMQLLDKDPERRPASAMAVGQSFQRILNDLEAPEIEPIDLVMPTETPPSPAPTMVGQRGMWIGLGLALVFGTLFGVLWGVLS